MSEDRLPWRERLRKAVRNRAEVAYSKQGAIAREAGITPGSLSRILTGRYSQPRFETIVRVAHAAHEKVGYLVDERTLSSHDEAELLAALISTRDAIDRVLEQLARSSALRNE